MTLSLSLWLVSRLSANYDNDLCKIYIYSYYMYFGYGATFGAALCALAPVESCSLHCVQRRIVILKIKYSSATSLIQ